MNQLSLIKPLIGAALALGLMMGSAASANVPAQSAKIDSSKSSVRWVGKKVTGSHNGHVTISSGEAKLEGDKLVGGEFEVAMTTIQVEDITNAKDNAKLTGHLKSDDFFSVTSFPVATFKITKAEPIANAAAGQPNYNITGDLSIKGMKHSITFPATITIGADSATANAKIAVDRTKYNVRYGSGKFFENLGDKLIYDEFEVDLDLVAKVG